MRTLISIAIVTALLTSALVTPVTWAGPVDINHADAVTIAKELQGIGPARAQAIVEYREKHGAFKSADELSKIKGVGTKVIEKNRANIRVSELAKK